MMESNPHFAICIENKEYRASLEPRKVYRLVEDSKAEERGYLRVIDESEEDYLYPAELFAPIQLPREAEKVFIGR